jgi:hypothetical protein
MLKNFVHLPLGNANLADRTASAIEFENVVRRSSFYKFHDLLRMLIALTKFGFPCAAKGMLSNHFAWHSRQRGPGKRDSSGTCLPQSLHG